ncbi:MAG: recombination mediator RecR [Thermodesulfovibrio sp.]|uniref:recombination mediator RecR n=1 Tax=Thermodesulfovibrio sp. N1 TaxID=1871110 RepID=UPI00083AA88D|nr:recombination mediator RecR [Thermodesulfovibrio sp. N1]MDI6714900.1 recombination mediator RecR [Thermodesulfovibrio sp.]ODA44514.1 Recombination protein RecR [Thermodesulfovibrio sp. N1]
MKLNPLENLIENLCKLPGIGRKTAQRLAFFIMSMEEKEALQIADSIINLKKNARYCSVCFNITQNEKCNICNNPERQHSIICVVEEPSNIVLIEKTGYKGVYHVLGGTFSPNDGITAEKLKIKELEERVKTGQIEEVIIATSPNTKGELTAQWIADILKKYKVKVSRIAYGLPIGIDIEFADEVTLLKALEGRKPINV